MAATFSPNPLMNIDFCGPICMHLSMSQTFPDLTFNPRARIDARTVGEEKMPLLVIDDVLLHPEQMVAFAMAHGRFSPPPDGSYYPGLNGILPPQYGPSLVSALRPLLARLFGIGEKERLSYEGFFGLSTLPADRLQPLQTIPHFDSDNPRRLAMVHYFCGPPFRGTALYRHLPTGFESVDGRRVADYRRHVFSELETDPHHDYVDAETPHYIQIDHVPAQFNRLAVYSTTSLHSALLSGAPLSDDPATGRLTANSFIEIHR